MQARFALIPNACAEASALAQRGESILLNA